MPTNNIKLISSTLIPKMFTLTIVLLAITFLSRVALAEHFPDGTYDISKLNESTPYHHNPIDVWLNGGDTYGYGPHGEFTLVLKNDRFYIQLDLDSPLFLADRVFSGKLQRKVNSLTGQVEIFGTVDSAGLVLLKPYSQLSSKWPKTKIDLFSDFEIKSFSLQANYSELKRVFTYRPANVADTTEGTFVVNLENRNQDLSRSKNTKKDSKAQFLKYKSGSEDERYFNLSDWSLIQPVGKEISFVCSRVFRSKPDYFAE